MGKSSREEKSRRAKAALASRLPPEHDQATNFNNASLDYSRFPGVIIIDKDRESALKAANDICDSSANARISKRFVLWPDGSTYNNKFGTSGIGIAYKTSLDQWATSSWHINAIAQDVVAEIAAISKALEFAFEDVCRTKARPESALILSDCQNALKRFLKSDFTDVPGPLIEPGLIAAHALMQRGIEVELRWVPGHRKVKGNVKADNEAKEGAKSKETNKDNALFFEVRLGGRKADRPPVALT